MAVPNMRERERDKFIGLFGDRGHRGPYSPYKPLNHNLYIGIIIFPQIWKYENDPLNMVGCSVVMRVGWTHRQRDGWTEVRTDGAGHNTLPPEWAEDKKAHPRGWGMGTRVCFVSLKYHLKGLVQDCSISSALAMRILLVSGQCLVILEDC